MQLNMTDSGIYYLHDYIPVRQFRYYSEEAVAISRKIWDYKDGDEDGELRKLSKKTYHG